MYTNEKLEQPLELETKDITLTNRYVMETPLNKELTQHPGMLISEPFAVSASALLDESQPRAFEAEHIEPLKNIVDEASKLDALAIASIQHPGRFAKLSAEEGQRVWVPTAMEFAGISYPLEEVSRYNIDELYKEFIQAASIIVDAGFAGIEIRGDRPSLLQQFFSTYSNKRTDMWGGTIGKRMNIPLTVFEKIREEVNKYNTNNFVIGYRFEGNKVKEGEEAYSLDDTLFLVENLISNGIDYLHLTFSELDEQIEEVYRAINGRVPLLVSAPFKDEEEFAYASEFADLLLDLTEE